MKRKSSKTRILTVLAALLLLLCSACGGAQGGAANNVPGNTANDAAAEPAGNTVRPLPVEDIGSRYVARDNGITVESAYEVSRINSLTIFGLKDKDIQQKINGAIRTECDRLLDPAFMPEGRGVKVYEKLATPIVSIYNIANANCDNILSVTINYTRLYRLSDGVEHISKIVPMTFDLATGNLLSLADLFPDGMDFRQYLNDRLKEMIQRSDPSWEGSVKDEMYYYTPQDIPALISEFKGIREDQPFYLEDKGVLMLVLDPGNPEFYMPTGSQTVTIDISEVYAASERFGGNKGLYEDNTDRYHMLTPQIPGGVIENIKPCTDYMDVDPQKVSGNVTLRYYPGLTESQNSFLAMESWDIKKMLKEESDELKEYLEKHPGTGKYIDISSYASRCGGFLNLSASYYCSMNDFSREVQNKELDQYVCMRYGSDEVLDIRSIFKEGVDWKSALKEAMIKRAEMTRSVYDAYEDPHTQLFSDYLDDMLDRISGFNIYPYNLRLSFDGSSAPEMFGDYTKNHWYYNNCVNFLDLADIGVENLNIFD